jgi:DNA-binding NarL/FixJ family response regulator
MRRAKVLLADDHEKVAAALARLLRDDFDLVATVHDGEALVDAARRLRPDVIVADIEMPVVTGLEALRQLRTEGITLPILFLTAHSDALLAAAAIRAGAAGFVLKIAAGDELVEAIGEVLAGRVYVSRRIAASLADFVQADREPGAGS